MRNMPTFIGTEKQRLAEKKKILRQRARKLTDWQKEETAKEKAKAVILAWELANVPEDLRYSSPSVTITNISTTRTPATRTPTTRTPARPQTLANAPPLSILKAIPFHITPKKGGKQLSKKAQRKAVHFEDIPVVLIEEPVVKSSRGRVLRKTAKAGGK